MAKMRFAFSSGALPANPSERGLPLKHPVLTLMALAIAIAAQSDEHLHLLQLLTRALGEGDLSQALREAREPAQILELLQGAPQALALDGQLVALAQPAEDFDELLWKGARLLRQAGYRGALPGLYLCGSGTHPGGGVTGAPGHNAAQAILADRPLLRKLLRS